MTLLRACMGSPRYLQDRRLGDRSLLCSWSPVLSSRLPAAVPQHALSIRVSFIEVLLKTDLFLKGFLTSPLFAEQAWHSAGWKALASFHLLGSSGLAVLLTMKTPRIPFSCLRLQDDTGRPITTNTGARLSLGSRSPEASSSTNGSEYMDRESPNLI